MIKILRGSGTEQELRAIEAALHIRSKQANEQNNFGRPILRAPIERENVNQE